MTHLGVHRNGVKPVTLSASHERFLSIKRMVFRIAKQRVQKSIPNGATPAY